MKISVGEENSIVLEEVFNSVILKTEHGEEMAICMRDTGFEFMYQGEWYFAQKGKITKTKSIKNKYQYVKMTTKNKSKLKKIYGDAANDPTATFQIII